MTRTKIRELAGIAIDTPWPEKLSFNIIPDHYSLADLHRFETYLHSIGYRNTAAVRRLDGSTQFVFTRQKNAQDDPTDLLIAAREQFMKESDARDGVLLSETWKTIDRINKWLEDS
jgi:hypothetical protein